MRMIRKFLVLISLVFLLSSCDDIEALLTLVPKFDSELPNVISGVWCYYSTEDDRVTKAYIDKYEFDPLEMSVLYDPPQNGSADTANKHGTYSYSYVKFAITSVSGYITIEFEDSSSVTYGFLYEATATKGPVSLHLINTSTGIEKTYYYEGEL